MTIDKQKLMALAEALGGQEWIYAEHDDCEFVESPMGFVAAADSAELGLFIAAASPATVLALFAEIEQWREAHAKVCLNYNRVSLVAGERSEEIDQLKAENEALRKDAGRYQWLKSNTTVMFRKTPSYVNTHGVLMHTCYPPEQELDAAVDWSIAKGVSRG